MNRRGHKGRTDANHSEVMDALRDAAMKAISLASVGDGCADVLVAFRGLNCLLEIKDGAKSPSERKLTAAEQKFHDGWPGQIAVVRTPEEAIDAVLKHAREMGRI